MSFRHPRALARSTVSCFLICTAAILLLPSGTGWAAHKDSPALPPIVDKDSHGTFAVEGEFVHNVGELQLNVTNWGVLGSHPGTQTGYSDAPSAMWPAGSGVDYLFEAGLWVGAVKNGVPLVSTGTGRNLNEILPNAEDPLDTVYTSFQGAAGGARYPDPAEDDDGDGVVDEDPPNGIDDDGDGLIDEDFAAIGNQHFRCTMRDNTALAQEFFPEHEPLDLFVVQESFQWENESVDDFIGLQFQVTNIGVSPLQNVVVGFFADCDAGPRDSGAVHEDDLPGFFDGAVRALDNSLVPISIGYTYDADGDGGETPGFFGVMFLNHPIDATGETAPQQVGITSFQTFSGRVPFDRGGDPGNDAERYDLMSRVEIDQVPPLFTVGREADFRILLSVGFFEDLEPGEDLTFQAAMVCGEGERGLLANAAEAALTFYGAYFDRDNNPDTGVMGRETQLCLEDFGDELFTVFQDCVDSVDLLGENPPLPIQPEDLDDDDCIYANLDCDFEERRGNENCHLEGQVAPEQLAGCTGVEGKEFFAPWLVGLAPTAPHLRLWQTDNRVHVFWNNISELIPDVRLQEIDFESYRIWRADNWDRPFGSSIENGPESKLWQLIAEFDEVNFFEDRRTLEDGSESSELLPLGPNTGLEVITYTPIQEREGTTEYVDSQPARDLVASILADEEFQRFLGPTIDPAGILRFRNESGQITPIGAAYPELQSYEPASYATVDTCFFTQMGVEFYEFVDYDVHNGIYYFYSVTASDFTAELGPDGLLALGPGLVGDPQSNFEFAVPRPESQTAEERDRLGQNIYVVPNPATHASLAEFSQLNPDSDDPTGVRVMFSNLPRARNTVKIYTLSGDLVQEILHDGRGGDGAAFWNLMSRNGQEVVSGVYLYSVESSDSAFDRVVGRFVVVR